MNFTSICQPHMFPRIINLLLADTTEKCGLIETCLMDHSPVGVFFVFLTFPDLLLTNATEDVGVILNTVGTEIDAIFKEKLFQRFHAMSTLPTCGMNFPSIWKFAKLLVLSDRLFAEATCVRHPVGYIFILFNIYIFNFI